MAADLLGLMLLFALARSYDATRRCSERRISCGSAVSGIGNRDSSLAKGQGYRVLRHPSSADGASSSASPRSGPRMPPLSRTYTIREKRPTRPLEILLGTISVGSFLLSQDREPQVEAVAYPNWHIMPLTNLLHQSVKSVLKQCLRTS
ncbi:hypothetical protein GY45DRAFT_1326946 [Cubamyces sp. BRFM 1775]|nr:hypothetical protein GY45DRAFT_1326946 [Cubamyces sp. BRFM 1775]